MATRMPRSPLSVLVLATLLVACGGGSGGSGGDVPLASDSGPRAGAGKPVGTDGPIVPDAPPPTDTLPGSILDDPDAPAFDPDSLTARYRITFENLWNAQDYPQEFPDDAHLSLIGGALHDGDVEFWAFGQPVSAGMDDLAETGRIDLLLYDEVVPAIEAGNASATIEYREYTGPMVDGVPGTSTFDIEANAVWPLLTLATMLGPSPDWFVGVSGLALDGADGWQERIVVDLPLLDGGTRSDIVPSMFGPAIDPPDPVGYIAYDPATGTYLPSDEPAVLARLTVVRVR